MYVSYLLWKCLQGQFLLFEMKLSQILKFFTFVLWKANFKCLVPTYVS